MAGTNTITSANAQFIISIPGIGVIAAPVQGFAMDAAFQDEARQVAEITMGIDGSMSAGFLFKEVKQKITLSPDSDSKDLFDAWFEAEQALGEILFADAILVLPSVLEGYTYTRGALSNYHGAPAGKKKLEPVEYEITWNRVSKAAA